MEIIYDMNYLRKLAKMHCADRVCFFLSWALNSFEIDLRNLKKKVKDDVSSEGNRDK